jgi:putative DNA-binding protein
MSRPTPPALQRTQELLWDLITAPEGAGQGLRDLLRDGRFPEAEVGVVVRGDERLGALDRIDIYAGMYFHRLRDCLQEDFPRVFQVMGGARSHNMVTDYLLAHPPAHRSLRHLGARLPGFLAGHSSLQEFPFLADLARLEWARADVFDDEDARSLSRADLSRTPADRLGDARFEVIPAFRLLELEWAAPAVWRELDDLGAAPHAGHGEIGDECGAGCHLDVPPADVAAPARVRTFVRVWRREFSILHRSIDADERACLLELARAGAGLPRLCEIILDASGVGPAADGETDRVAAATRRMAGLLDLWLEDGILRALPGPA